MEIIKAATEFDSVDRIEVLVTDESVNEYPEFYNRFVKPLRFQFVSAPVTSYLNQSRLIGHPPFKRISSGSRSKISSLNLSVAKYAHLKTRATTVL